jgi:hypothetical protein
MYFLAGRTVIIGEAVAMMRRIGRRETCRPARGHDMRLFGDKDVVRLLRSEVKQIGSTAAWAKRAGVDRAVVSKVLNGRLHPSMRIISALNLQRVFVLKPPQSK